MIERGMKDRLINVRVRCEALLAENVASLLVQNNNLNSQITKLGSQNAKLQQEMEGRIVLGKPSTKMNAYLKD